VFKRFLAKAGTGLAGLIFVIIASASAIVTSLGIPTLIVLVVFHLGPFSKTTPSDNTAQFCSTLNVMSNYGASHNNPTTAAQEISTLQHSASTLSRARGIPSSMTGTVSATISTTNKLITLIQAAVDNGGLTTSQRTQVVGLDGVLKHEASTMNKWYQSNC